MSFVAYYVYDDADGEVRLAGKCDESRVPTPGEGQTLVVGEGSSDPAWPGKSRIDLKTGAVVPLNILPTDDKVAVLKQSASSVLESGFTSNALGEKYQYGSTVLDQMNLLMGGPQRCADANGIWALRDHTPEQLGVVKQAFISLRDSTRNKLDLVVAQAKAASTQEELSSVTWGIRG